MSRKNEDAAPDSPAAAYAPRFACAWAAIVYALSAMTLTYPALAGKFLVNPLSDQYKAGYSFRDFAAQTLKSTGSFPQWDPYIFGGMPYVAAMHGDIFYPTFLLRLILPTDVAMTWGMILHFFLCGVATYWFLASAGKFSFFPALIGGAAYMMGGFVSSLPSAGHDGKIFVSALFPVALLVLTWAMRDGKRWAWGAFSLTIGLAVLTPHPQLLQYRAAHLGRVGTLPCVRRDRRGEASLARRPAAARARARRSDYRRRDRRNSIPAGARICELVAARAGIRLRNGDVVFVSDRRADQHVSAAVLWNSRKLLGPEQHSLSQRVHRRRGADTRVRRVRRRDGLERANDSSGSGSGPQS